VASVEAAVETVAPGFGATIVGRNVQSPDDLERPTANLVGGAVNGGPRRCTAAVPAAHAGHRASRDAIEGLFLASASAHPGGGVHGACGWNAARSALSASGRLGPARRSLVRTAWGRLLR
jgi:phytoene dehydrogenase-like protein